MTKPMFFKSARNLTIGEIAALTGAEPRPGSPLDRVIGNLAPLDRAGPNDLAFFDNAAYHGRLRATRAGACLVTARFESEVPGRVIVLCVRNPYRAFVNVARALFPDALRPSSLFEAQGTAIGAFVHPTARVESGVTVDPGAVIGPRAEIGAGTTIGPTAVIGPGVRFGRDGMIGAGATISNAVIGDRVIIHPGCRIGQDGFGYQMDAGRHGKIPQVGRVIIQDDVEIGAGSAIDRGAMGDTVVGEGTKIDNLVQIGHNVSIGRHCVIVAQTGISGSVTLEDYVMLGGQVGIADHLTIGEGAQIGASSGLMRDVPAGEKWFGTPAKPAREQFREIATLRRLTARTGRSSHLPPDGTDTDQSR
ncbi:MAG: UDP-3-O-(3-hydroxymyristoyl)glucosamine N-acyltransferase [Rhizobiales bacterium]|nr:UDP-3-O-(3-hydroxymyristoyl)glucosamine N-acyltransferase [Hyphomicrobiales bacterium]